MEKKWYLLLLDFLKKESKCLGMSYDKHKSRHELLSRKQIAKMAAVHPGTVKRWECRDKVLTPIRINSRVIRYDKAQVDKLLGRSRHDD